MLKQAEVFSKLKIYFREKNKLKNIDSVANNTTRYSPEDLKIFSKAHNFISGARARNPVLTGVADMLSGGRKNTSAAYEKITHALAHNKTGGTVFEKLKNYPHTVSFNTGMAGAGIGSIAGAIIGKLTSKDEEKSNVMAGTLAGLGAGSLLGHMAGKLK